MVTAGLPGARPQEDSSWEVLRLEPQNEAARRELEKLEEQRKPWQPGPMVVVVMLEA